MKDIYKLKGYKDREDYLKHLASEYGIDYTTVAELSIFLGPSEDFDGLLNALDDIDNYGIFDDYDDRGDYGYDDDLDYSDLDEDDYYDDNDDFIPFTSTYDDWDEDDDWDDGDCGDDY